MTLEPEVAEMIQSPLLPSFIRQLQDYLAEEQERRKVFHANLPEGEKVEFINGEVVKAMSVKNEHGIAMQLLLALLQVFVNMQKLGVVGAEKYMIALDRNDYEPDICFWSVQKSEAMTQKQMIFPPPDLVIEVLSPSTEERDRGIKFRDYAANRISEYWIIDPDVHSVEQYVLDGRQYRLRVKVMDGVIASAVVAGFEIPVRAIFDPQENLVALRKIINS